MKKNIFDRISDSYEHFHLQNSEIRKGTGTIVVSPKLKLILGWSIFVLCCVLAYFFAGLPFGAGKSISSEDKKAVLEQDVKVDEEHKTIVPYKKNADKELNTFIEKYYKAVTDCDNETLQDMVTNPEEFSNADSLKQKADFITGYDNITVYTKEGLDEGSYVAFVVSNLTISGVNSSPYDIATFYIVNGARGYLINNGTLSADAQEYVEKIKGDKDIQEVYKAVEKENNDLKEKDQTLKDFYDIISRRNVKTDSMADQLSTEEAASGEDTQTESTTQESTTQAESTQEGTTQAETAAAEQELPAEE